MRSSFFVSAGATNCATKKKQNGAAGASAPRKHNWSTTVKPSMIVVVPRSSVSCGKSAFTEVSGHSSRSLNSLRKKPIAAANTR